MFSSQGVLLKCSKSPGQSVTLIQRTGEQTTGKGWEMSRRKCKTGSYLRLSPSGNHKELCTPLGPGGQGEMSNTSSSPRSALPNSLTRPPYTSYTPTVATSPRVAPTTYRTDLSPAGLAPRPAWSNPHGTTHRLPPPVPTSLFSHSELLRIPPTPGWSTPPCVCTFPVYIAFPLPVCLENSYSSFKAQFRHHPL